MISVAPGRARASLICCDSDASSSIKLLVLCQWPLLGEASNHLEALHLKKRHPGQVRIRDVVQPPVFVTAALKRK